MQFTYKAVVLIQNHDQARPIKTGKTLTRTETRTILNYRGLRYDGKGNTIERDVSTYARLSVVLWKARVKTSCKKAWHRTGQAKSAAQSCRT